LLAKGFFVKKKKSQMELEEIRKKLERNEYEISYQKDQGGLMKGEEVKVEVEEMREMHKYGDCSFCGGRVKSDKVELVYQYRGRLYIFQNVPAGVCEQCGEKYLTAQVAKEIEHRIQTKEKWDKTITVPVGVFAEEAAL
jgi:YgiT-type zinc finger domain-containing protein